MFVLEGINPLSLFNARLDRLREAKEFAKQHAEWQQQVAVINEKVKIAEAEKAKILAAEAEAAAQVLLFSMFFNGFKKKFFSSWNCWPILLKLRERAKSPLSPAVDLHHHRSSTQIHPKHKPFHRLTFVMLGDTF